MNKKALTFCVALFLAAGAQAQPGKSLVNLEKEIIQAKSTATATALIESMAETTPQTDADVAALGRLMDKYPTYGQKAASRIVGPNLASAVMKECARQVAKVMAVRGKRKNLVTDEDRQDYISGYMNSAALIGVLVKLKDKNSIPMLRGYVQDEDFSAIASVALGRLGDTESMERMLRNVGTGAPIDLSGYGDKGLVRVVEELDKPELDLKRKDALINQIKGSASPERKRMLKDLALKHKDPRVRDRSALALLNSIMANPEPGDQAFVSQWIARTKNEETGDWAAISIRVAHGNGARPLSPPMEALLVDLLQTSTRESVRGEAALDMGMFNVKGAAPYLKECLLHDKESSVRTECRHAYWKIMGNVPAEFHPADFSRQENYYKRPDVADSFSKKNAVNPEDQYPLSLKRAFDEYKKASGK